LECSDIISTLQEIQYRRAQLISSCIPILNFGLVPLVGLLPYPLFKHCAKLRGASVIMSNFPGPPSNADFFGYPILDVSFGGGLGPGNLGNHFFNIFSKLECHPGNFKINLFSKSYRIRCSHIELQG